MNQYPTLLLIPYDKRQKTALPPIALTLMPMPAPHNAQARYGLTDESVQLPNSEVLLICACYQPDNLLLTLACSINHCLLAQCSADAALDMAFTTPGGLLIEARLKLKI